MVAEPSKKTVVEALAKVEFRASFEAVGLTQDLRESRTMRMEDNATEAYRCDDYSSATREHKRRSSRSPAVIFILVLLVVGQAPTAIQCAADAGPVSRDVNDWTGFYMGASTGFATDRFAFPFSVTLRDRTLSGSSAITSDGPLGGVQIGYNYQFDPGWVAGLELDNSWSAISGSVDVGPASSVSARFGTAVSHFATARLRAGYAIGRFLPYLTAGLTVATARTNFSVDTASSIPISQSSTATRSGIFPHVGAAGLGLEYRMTQNLSVKAEYLYDFVNARYALFEPEAGVTVGFGTREMYHVFRIGLNWQWS